MANLKNAQNHEFKIQKWLQEGRGQGFGNTVTGSVKMTP